jgi:hypothetical protein
MSTSDVAVSVAESNVATLAEERARRLTAEVERLASQSPAEWMFWLDDCAKKHGVEPAKLAAMVKAVQAERAKAQRESKAELQRTEKRREFRDKTDAKRAEAEARREEKESARAEKDEARKQKAIEAELKKVVKLPRDEQQKRLAELSAQFEAEMAELHRDLERLMPRRGHDEIELWPEPVATEDLLRDVTRQIRRYVIISDDGAMTVALWTLFAWVHDRAVHSPILLVTSAEKDSGKSTLLGVASFLTPCPYATVELTGPGLFHLVDYMHPTLIVDEADKLFARKNDLLHIANAGWTKGTKVTRIASGFPREFDVFCPKIIGMKGLFVPDTLSSRGIIVKLWPKKDDEKVEDFRYCDDETFETLRRKAARWAKDVGDKVAAAQPAMPIGFSNRTATNWRVPLAIAELAGCLEAAQRAAVALVHKRRGHLSEGLRLLAAIREVLGSRAVITSRELVKKLTADADGEWCEFKHGGPITKRQVALLLDQYDIHPVPLHVGKHSTTERGYRAEWFADVFARYLPSNRATVSGKR